MSSKKLSREPRGLAAFSLRRRHLVTWGTVSGELSPDLNVQNYIYVDRQRKSLRNKRALGTPVRVSIAFLENVAISNTEECRVKCAEGFGEDQLKH